MKHFWIVASWLSLLSCQAEKETNKPLNAELFGRGGISTEAPEFSTTINVDQDQIFFNRTTPDRSSMWIMYSEWKEDHWTQPKNLAFSTGKYLDVDPFLTADGNRLYFSSDRPIDSLSYNPDILNTWYVEKRRGTWSDPIKAEYPLNSDSTEIFVSMTQSGNAYFVSERGEVRGIMVCKLVDGQYQDAIPLELHLRGEPIYASNPCISSDESFLIVASRDPEGNGRPDLFVSWNEQGEWSEMINLGPAINSPYAEFAPGLSKDDQILYFTSERPGIMPEQEEGVRPPGDIYHINIQGILDQLKN